MIVGKVKDGEAVVPLTLRADAGGTRRVEAVIDTGSGRDLTLPPDLFEEFARGERQAALVGLAGATEIPTWTQTVEVLWDGVPRRVTVVLLDDVPLIGMPLLEGHCLTIDVTEGGPVRIEPLDA